MITTPPSRKINFRLNLLKRQRKLKSLLKCSSREAMIVFATSYVSGLFISKSLGKTHSDVCELNLINRVKTVIWIFKQSYNNSSSRETTSMLFEANIIFNENHLIWHATISLNMPNKKQITNLKTEYTLIDIPQSQTNPMWTIKHAKNIFTKNIM